MLLDFGTTEHLSALVSGAMVTPSLSAKSSLKTKRQSHPLTPALDGVKEWPDSGMSLFMETLLFKEHCHGF